MDFHMRIQKLVDGFTEIGIAICDEVALAPANFFGTMAFCMRGKGISPKIYANFKTMKKFSSLLTIRKLQIKTTIKYHYKSIKWLK